MAYRYLLLPNDTFKYDNTEWGYFCLWRDRNSVNALIRLVFSTKHVFIFYQKLKKIYFKGKLTWLKILNVLSDGLDLWPSVLCKTRYIWHLSNYFLNCNLNALNLPTHQHIYIHTFIHTHMHTYIHTSSSDVRRSFYNEGRLIRGGCASSMVMFESVVLSVYMAATEHSYLVFNLMFTYLWIKTKTKEK